MTTRDINELLNLQFSQLKNYSSFAKSFSEYFAKKAATIQDFAVQASEIDTDTPEFDQMEDEFLLCASDIYNKTVAISKKDFAGIINGDTDLMEIKDATGAILDTLPYNEVSNLISSAYAEEFGLSGFYKELAETVEYSQADLISKLQLQLGSISIPNNVRSLILSIADKTSGSDAFMQSVAVVNEFEYNGYDWSDTMYEKGDIIIGVGKTIAKTLSQGISEIVDTIEGFKSFCIALMDGLAQVMENILSLLNPAILTDYEIVKAGKDMIWSTPICTFTFTLDDLTDFIARDGGNHLFDSTVIYNFTYPQTWDPADMVVPHCSLGLNAQFEDRFYHLFEDSKVVYFPLGNLFILLKANGDGSYLCEFFLSSLVINLNGDVQFAPNLSGGKNEDFYRAFMDPLNYSVLGQMRMSTEVNQTISAIPDGSMLYRSGYAGRGEVIFTSNLEPEDFRSNQILSRIKYKGDTPFANIPASVKNALYYGLLLATRSYDLITASSSVITMNGNSVTIGSTGKLTADSLRFYPYCVSSIPAEQFHIQTKRELISEATNFLLKAVAAAAAIAIGVVVAKHAIKLKKSMSQRRLVADKLGRDYAANPTPENFKAYAKANRKANRTQKLAQKLGLAPSGTTQASGNDIESGVQEINDVITGPN